MNYTDVNEAELGLKQDGEAYRSFILEAKGENYRYLLTELEQDVYFEEPFTRTLRKLNLNDAPHAPIPDSSSGRVSYRFMAFYQGVMQWIDAVVYEDL